MEVVRRIFRSVAGGATVYNVRRSLEETEYQRRRGSAGGTTRRSGTSSQASCTLRTITRRLRSLWNQV
jgi:hypothetical protein